MKFINLVLISLMSFALLACGDSTRNDQGVSFTFFGWFADSGGAEGRTGIILPLTQGLGNEAIGNTGSNDSLVFAGLQNNLTGQFIQAQRIIHKYKIPGASITPPSTSDSAALFLGPAVAGEAAGGGAAGGGAAANQGITSSLPNSFAQPNTGYAQVFLIPPQVRQFIALNRASMPPAPFTMVVSSYVTGITSSGKRIDSNEIQIDVLFTDDLVITPGAAGGGGVVDGGDDDGGAVAP